MTVEKQIVHQDTIKHFLVYCKFLKMMLDLFRVQVSTQQVYCASTDALETKI